jgi:secreted trypsin-like serine protease
MRKSKFGLKEKAGIVLLVSSLIPLMALAPAKAVTFGTDITDPAVDAPYVVSIWTSADNDSRNAEFLCSGSLIAPKIVLTAAHCTMETTSYFVKVKAPTLNSNVEFVTVSGVWRSPRYNPKTFVNDIGLLKLDESFEGMPFPTLANAQTAKSINKFSRLRIFGWGLDQELEQTDFLRTADLLLQDASAAKTFGKTFNIKTMLAAGKKIVSENVWSGGCRGDSGGPLISNVNGIDLVVGVTSWGSAKCLPNKPTVFNRVSYYFNEIKAGIRAVEASSVNINRSAPVAITNPSITGEAIPGQTLKCNPGTWKNALSVQASWTSPSRLIGSSSLNVQVLPTDGGSEFKCEVIASSQSANVRRVISKFVLGKSTLRTNPVIAGISSGTTFKNGQMVRCEGWNWTNPVDSERITWFTASSSNPSTPVNGRMIGSGSTLTFTPEILKNEKGRYLICQVTGVKDGFESHFAASQYISTPSAPVLGSVSISYYNLNDGSSVSCSYTKPSDADEVKVEWGSFTGNYFSAIPWLSGDRVTITKAVIQSAAGKSFACRVTASNLGGESVKTSYTQDSFEALPSTPTVSTSLSSSNPTAGSYANCFASNTGSYSNIVTYQWGLTRTTGTNFIEGSVMGTSNTLYFNSTNLPLLSGAFLTCVVTVTNGAGFVQGNSSSTIPLQSIVLPTPTGPSVTSQNASNTSITVTMSIPQISNFNSNTMQAKLTITGSSNCVDKLVDPGMTYECSGLSGNTTYSTFLTVVAKSGNGTSTRSSTSSFTTTGLSGQPVYVCGQSCTGSLSQSAMLSYLDDKRLVEAGAKPGGPITSSTCIGSGCNSGSAPALPVSCGTGSIERTSLVANVSAQITTNFRYCSPPLDTTAPTIVDASATYTGYAKIIPTTAIAGSNISVRFVARDAIGIASSSARLVNPSGVVVSTVAAVFQTGSVTDGAYLGVLATASSGPLAGDTYQIQVQARDAAGNTSAWFSLGTFIVQSGIDTTAPSINGNSVSPSSISTGANIVATFNASDAVGITGCSATVYNVNNIDVVTSTSCTRTSGTNQNGTWQATINMNSSNNPGSYTVKGFLRDAAGNQSTLTTLGTFTINGPSVSNLGTLPTPVTIGINYLDQIVLNGFNFGNLGVAPGGYTWTVQTRLNNGTVVSTLPVGSNQTYITGLLGNTTYKVYLIATDTSGASKSSSPLTVTTLIPALSAGLVPTLASPRALNNYTSYTVQITNYNSSYTWTATASVGNASINNTGLVTVTNWPEATSSTLTVATSRVGYQNGSASIVANCDLSPFIQAQNITATLSGSNLTVNVPNPRGWSWSVIWDGTVQRTNITSFPITITGFTTNKNIQLAAIDSSSNYGYSRVFLPTVTALAQPAGPVISTNNVYIGVPSLAIGAQQTVEVSISSSIDVTLTQLWVYDSKGESVGIAQGSRVSGTNTSGRWKFDFSIPASGVGGAVSKGSWQLKANANDSAGYGSSTGTWVNIGSFNVE